jgi:hypothetical protein
MRAHADKPGFRGGTSLVEVVLALVMFMVVALGSAYYRYLTAVSMQKAQAQLTGTDLAVTLLGTWQGVGGSVSFGPDNRLASYMTISPALGGSAPNGYTLLGAYDVDLGGRIYRSTLYWRNIETDFRELGVAVSWPLGDGGQQKTFQLSTYARL